MKCLAMLEVGKVGWIERPYPTYGPNDAIVRPLALSPCTSDVHTVWEGALGDRKDLVLGHEAVGVVEKVGECVTRFKPGDRVIVSALTPDWLAPESQMGWFNHSGGMLAGWKLSNTEAGTCAESFKVIQADANLAPLPDWLRLEDAAMLTDMVVTGFYGAEMANIEMADQVCVVGIGAVGLCAVRGAVLRGASRVFAVGTRPVCVKVARQYGATDIISYKDGSIADQVLEATGGRGVERVIICGGTVDTFAEAVKMCRPGGVIANVGYLGFGENIPIPRTSWGCGMSDITIKGGLTKSGGHRIERILELIRHGRLDVSPLVTHTFYGLDKMQEALEMMRDKAGDLIKPVVIVSEE